MKKLTFSIIATLLVTVSAFSIGGGGGGGIQFPMRSAFNQAKPAAYPCATGFQTFATNTNIVGANGNGLRGTCPSPNNCTSTFAGRAEALRFKNTALEPACVTIKTTVVTTNAQQLCFSVDAPYTANMTCAGSAGRNFNDTGGFFAWFLDNYDKNVPACTDFDIVYWGFNGASSAYDLTVTNTTAPGLIACSGAECKKLLTIGGTPVPTMTQWGLFLFGLIILTFASVALYNFTQRASVKQ
ncbi:MAG: hypothetical protein IPO86_13345 [Saprospiraceae bacterium]|nr:hypothetical protein [Saprospiraceae bacterium]MBK9729091.1 hypothetical protein [Saprospiraceae bacterium]